MVDDELTVLLSEPFARAFEAADEAPPAAATATATAVSGPGPGLRQRLHSRVQATREAEAGMVTVRLRRQAGQALAPGVLSRLLYAAPQPASLRPGEPLRAQLLDVAAGHALDPAVLGPSAERMARHLEWLVVSGAAEVDGQSLSDRDYLVIPAGCDSPRWQATRDLRLFLRESPAGPASSAPATHLVRDAEAGWPDFAPGIQRRVLWQSGGQAALLYYAQAGASVPNHVHGHDEECLMVQGELFLDDVLLQTGDYQLAPAGGGHRITHTDTGVVIYAHGDLDLQFV